jgi:predicted nucleic acid-binding Zn ribbon protein
MFEAFGSVVRRNMRRGRVGGQLRAAVVIAQASAALEELFGSESAAKMRPRSFRDGRLKIACDASVYAEEIRLREKEVIASINARLGGPYVKVLYYG